MTSVPRCYSSPFAYEADNPVCLACAVNSGCSKDALHKLAILKETVLGRAEQREDDGELDALEPQPTVTEVKVERRAKTTVAVKPKEGPSKKGSALIFVIGKWTQDLKVDLLNGNNPFRGKTPSYFEFVCDLLIQNKTIQRNDLVARLVERFSWSAGTATSHFWIIQSALSHLGFKATDSEIGIE